MIIKKDVIELLKPSMKTKEVSDLIDEMLDQYKWTLDDWGLLSWALLTPEHIVHMVEELVNEQLLQEELEALIEHHPNHMVEF